MTRLEWYHWLRSGREPMRADLAWLQALVYDGKTPEEVLERKAVEGMRDLSHMVICTYEAMCWESSPGTYPTFRSLVTNDAPKT